MLDPANLDSEITRIDLIAPVSFRVENGHQTVLHDYEVGTVLELTVIRLGASVPLDLDRSGTGRIAAGSPLFLDVTVTPPGDRAMDTEWLSELPWALTVTATEDELTVAPWSDGVGGTFEVL